MKILPRGLKRRSTAARLLRSWVRIPPGACMFVCCVLCVRIRRNDELEAIIKVVNIVRFIKCQRIRWIGHNKVSDIIIRL